MKADFVPLHLNSAKFSALIRVFSIFYLSISSITPDTNDYIISYLALVAICEGSERYNVARPVSLLLKENVLRKKPTRKPACHGGFNIKMSLQRSFEKIQGLLF